MKFRSIPSPVHTPRYIVESIQHCNENNSLIIYLQHAISFKNFRARIVFKNVSSYRFTPLHNCLSIYCEQMHIFMTENPESAKAYEGIAEVIGIEEMAGRYRGRDQKHYVIITEDEYVEVASSEDPFIEDLNPL